MRNERPERATSTRPASSKACAYCWVARRSSTATRPPGAGRARSRGTRARGRRRRRGCGWRSTRRPRRSARPRTAARACRRRRTSTRSRDALGLGVRERRRAAVVRLVGRGPEVDADGAAARQALRGADQQQPAPAADVEDLLVAPERRGRRAGGRARAACRAGSSGASRRRSRGTSPRPARTAPARPAGRPRSSTTVATASSAPAIAKPRTTPGASSP